MKLITNILGSSLGKKYLMAVSGCFLFLFVVGHLVGNLQVFLGPEAVNRYGHFLKSNPELIWPARFFLLSMIGLHIWSAVRLSLENKAARPSAYARYEPVGSSYASRTMLMSGGIVFLFIVYHLLHYTALVEFINRTGRDFASFVEHLGPNESRHDIFKMMVVGFNNVWVSGFYIAGLALLCLHLSHGVSATFQSLGWRNTAYRPLLDRFASGVAALIFLGYTSIPVAILLGYGKEALK